MTPGHGGLSVPAKGQRILELRAGKPESPESRLEARKSLERCGRGETYRSTWRRQPWSRDLKVKTNLLWGAVPLDANNGEKCLDFRGPR